jgi:glycosyltransferase involved in cell wall biosynthesis
MRNGISGHQKNVLMVVENGYPMAKGGGAESQVNTLATRMMSLGWNVRIIAPMVSYASQVNNDVVNGVPVYRIAYPKIRLLGGVFMLLRLALHLIKHQSSYDIIHVHIATNMAAVCSLVGKLLKKPVLVKLTGWTEIQGGILDDKKSLRITLLKLAIRQATHYQATSQQIATLLAERGFDIEKINQIPNAVDTDRFNGLCKIERPGYLSTARVGIFVGRLVAEKNLQFFLKVFSDVYKNDDISLLIIGDGYLRETLESQVETLNIKHKVHFLGAKPDVENYIAMADFGILPSLYEGLSNTLLECMSSGIPVIGSRVSGTEDLIDDNVNGWLFDSNNEIQLAHCLNKLKCTSDDDLKIMGDNARKFIIDYAGISSVTDNIMSLYFKQASGKN